MHRSGRNVAGAARSLARLLAGLAALSVLLAGQAPPEAQAPPAQPQAPACAAAGQPGMHATLQRLHDCLPDREMASLARSALNAELPEQSEPLSRLGAILRLPEEVLRKILAIVARQDLPAEDIAEQLAEKAEAHRALLEERLDALQPGDGILKMLVASSRDAARTGRYEDAANMLTKVVIASEKMAQGDAAATSFTDAALARAAIGQISLIQSDFRNAAIYFDAAIRLLPQEDADRRSRFRLDQAGALYLQGRDKRDDAAFRQAADHYRALITATPRESQPVKWADLQTKLGSSLLRLGARAGDVAPLIEAAAAFRAALPLLPRAPQSLDWARAQHDLGSTLLRIGLVENSTERLREAATAFKESLKDGTRERAQHHWASAQSNLGTALWSLGARQVGTMSFEEAAVAFREGLKATSREHTPFAWAARQNNLGATLIALAERTKSVKEVREAAEAFKLALDTYDKENAGFYTGGVQENLAQAEALMKEYALGSPAASPAPAQ